jgi:two-component system, sensor histidine kinase PdtaS
LKKISILILLLSLCCINLFASSKIDSLETVLTSMKEKDKPESLNRLAKLYLEVDLEMSLECALQANELAQRFKQTEEEARANYNIAVYHRKKGDYPNSLSFNLKSLELYQKIGDEFEIAYCYKSIGNDYNFQGIFNSALEFYFKALGISLSLNNNYLVASLYNNIGICYNRLGDYNLALENYYESLKIKQEMLKSGELHEKDIRIYSTLNNIGNLHLRMRDFEKALSIFLQEVDNCTDAVSTSKLLNNIGIAYQELGDLEKALFYYQRALSMNKKLNRKDKIATSLNNIGYIHDIQEDWPETLKFYKKALDFKEEIGDQFGIANGKKNVGSIYLELKQYKTAYRYLQESIVLAENIGALEIVKDDFNFLSRLYHEQNNDKLAYEYGKKYSILKDSLYHESMAAQLAAIETNYELAKSGKENEKLQKDNLQYKLNIQIAHLEKMRYLILVLMLLLLSVIITFAYFQKRVITRLLQKTKKELEVKVNIRTNELAASNIALRKEITERTKAEVIIKDALEEKEVMLREIHHRVKNNLQIISSILNLQSHGSMSDQSQSILENTRNRVYSMSLIHEKLYLENNLAQIDFKDYLSGLLNYILGNYDFEHKRINLKFDIKKIFLNLDTAIPCGLLINEIFTNSIKHAFQNLAEGLVKVVMFKDKDDYFHLEISDNGNIIKSEEELTRHKSMGMQLIRLLSKQINSEMIVDVSDGVKYSFKFLEK